jgi:uncharacterized protein (UPF0335 family)
MVDENVSVTAIPVGGAEALKDLVDRIERLEEEKKAISDDIKDVYTDASAKGFDKKVLRLVIKLRKMSRQDREEEETVKDLYLQALGEI